MAKQKTFKNRQAQAKQAAAKSIDVFYKQGLFIQCKADMVLYGGAAGG